MKTYGLAGGMYENAGRKFFRLMSIRLAMLTCGASTGMIKP